MFNSLYTCILAGVILITPFFSSGQSVQVSSKNFSLQELLDRVHDFEDIDIAYDPLSIRGVVSNRNCLSQKSLVDCLIQSHQHTFEFVWLSPNKLLMRSYSRTNDDMIYGQVIDRINGQPLAFAEIVSMDDQKLIVADAFGNFSLPLFPEVRTRLVTIHYIGYESQLLELTASQHPQMIAMESQPIETPTAHIVSALPIISGRSINDKLSMSAEAAGQLPAALAGDVLRGLTLLPGISATNDVSSELTIRGGNSEQNLILLNHVPIYQTGHFYNLFSILNDDPIKNLNLYKNYLPVHAGDATTGLLEIRLKDPLAHEPTIHADLNLLTSDLYASTSVKDKFGISISARTTNGNVAQGAFKKVYTDDTEQLIIQTQEEIEVFQSTSEPDVTFHDLIASWNWKLSSTTRLSGIYMYAADDVSIRNVYSITSRNGRAAVDYSYLSRQSWNNKGGGLSLNHEWSPRMSMTLDAYISDFDRQDETHTSLSGGQNLQEPRSLDKLRFSMSDGISDHSLRMALHSSSRVLSSWQTGYQFQRLATNTDLIRGERSSASSDVSAAIHTFFISGDLPIGDRWKLSSGLRTSYHSLQDKMYFSPRIKLHFKPNDALSFKSSAAIYNQYLRSITLLNANNANKDIWTLAQGMEIPILTSRMAMFGATWVSNVFTMDAEFYYRQEDGVVQELIPSSDNNLQSTTLYTSLPDLFIGIGRRYGMDLMVKHSGKSIQSILTYTLSKGEVSFETYQEGRWINAANDRRHELNWYNMISQGRFDWHVNTVFASGNPYYAYTIGRDSKFNPGYKALDAYSRCDLGTAYNFHIGRQKATIGFEIFNVFNHQNKSSVRYARLNQLQDQTRTTLFTESIDLLDRTANIKFQIQIK